MSSTLPTASTASSPAAGVAAPGLRKISVLLVSSDIKRRQAWKQSLPTERFEPLELPLTSILDTPPEVIVTDQTLASLDFAPFHEQMIHGEIGVVLVGKNLPADVVLADDCTPRELRLACRLLSQVVSLRRQNQRLVRLSVSDPLTGLPNRRALEEHFERFSAEARPSPPLLLLALFDLDRFKPVNAELGLIRGDDVLRKAAKTLRAKAGEHFVARYGGDEFILLSRATSLSEAFALVEELRRGLGTAASLTAERPVSASAGIVLTSESESLPSLISQADQALRNAKQAGGKRTECA